MADYRDWTSSRRFVTKQLNYRNPYFPRESFSEKRKRRQRFIVIGIIIVCLAVSYFLFISPVFQIREITVEGGTTDRISFIENRVDEYLQGKMLGVIKNDNWFLVSSNRLKNWLDKDLMNKISLETLTIEKAFPHTIHVTFRERTAQLILQADNQSYLLDRQGYVISEQYLNPVVETKEGAPAAEEPSKTIYPILRHETKSAVSIGQQIIPAALAQSILETNRMFLEKYQEISIDHFETIVRDCPDLPKTDETETTTNENTNSDDTINSNIETNTNEEVIEKEIVPCTEQPMVEYIVVVPSGVKLYFSSKYSTNDQIGAFTVSYNDKIGGLFDRLTYIDLRYPGRVYYK